MNNQQFSSVKELKAEVLIAWSTIEDKIQNLVISKNRLNDVIRNNGSQIDFSI